MVTGCPTLFCVITTKTLPTGDQGTCVLSAFAFSFRFMKLAPFRRCILWETALCLCCWFVCCVVRSDFLNLITKERKPMYAQADNDPRCIVSQTVSWLHCWFARCFQCRTIRSDNFFYLVGTGRTPFFRTMETLSHSAVKQKTLTSPSD